MEERLQDRFCAHRDPSTGQGQSSLVFEESLKFDVLVEACLLVELKAVREIAPIHKAQLISHMKLMDIALGLLINFNEVRLVDGVSRLLLPGSNR